MGIYDIVLILGNAGFISSTANTLWGFLIIIIV